MIKKQAEKLSQEIKRWNLANDGKDGDEYDGDGGVEDGGEGIGDDVGMV